MVKPRGQTIQLGGKIAVTFFREGKQYVAYAPALDLSTCGETFDEARKNLVEALHVYIDECAQRGTLARALESYGWQRSKTRPPRWEPPVEVGHENIPLEQLTHLS
jgi:predicted RNase H-like HicB family nuclease